MSIANPRTRLSTPFEPFAHLSRSDITDHTMAATTRMRTRTEPITAIIRIVGGPLTSKCADLQLT